MEAIQTLNPADVWEVAQKVIVWLAGIGIVIDLTPGIKVQPVRWLIKQLGNLMNHDMKEQLDQQKKSIIISSGNYPNILFPGTLPKNLRILQDCIWPFLQQSCYHFYLFRIHEKVPMNYYIQSLLRQSNIYVGK